MDAQHAEAREKLEQLKRRFDPDPALIALLEQLVDRVRDLEEELREMRSSPRGLGSF